MNVPQNIGRRQDNGDVSSFDDLDGDEQSFDIRAIFRLVRRRISVILGVGLALTVLSALVIFQLTPRYTSTVVLMLNPPKENVIDFDAVLSGGGNDAAAIASEIEILQSRALAGQVIDALDLSNDPEISPALVMPNLGWRAWVKSLFGFETTVSPDVVEATRQNAAIEKFLSMVAVKQKLGTRLLELSFTSENAKNATKIAQTIAETYISNQIEAKFEATRQANLWLAKRLDELARQLQDSERAVALYRTQNGLQSSGGVTLNEQQLSELNAQLILARADATAKKAKYDQARKILAGHGSIDSVTDVLQSATISGLRTQEAELARQQADLSTKYGARHPAILNISAQRKDINRQISAEISRIVGGIKNEVIVAESRENALEQSLNQMQNKTGQDSEAAVRLNELVRQAQANKTVYEAFLNRFKETGQQQDLQTADSRIINPAVLPLSPSFPDFRKLLLLAVVVSFSVGGGLALLLEFLDNGITTPDRVESVLGVPHLVSIPLIPKEKGEDGKLLDPPSYILKKPLSAYSEAARSLRSTLALSNVDSPPKVILFTSSLPDEGKTTTSVSFGRAAALADRKVLLIDCDLRHPSVHRELVKGSTPTKGLVEVLAGNCSLEEALLRDPGSELHYLPVASGTVNPPDLLGSEQMRRLVARCRAEYDLVIFDSPPVLPVVDSRVLAQFADKTVFIVRWQTTPFDAARTAMKELRQANVDVVGAVLTLVNLTAQAKYGRGGAGSYYGRYSNYYSN